MTSVREIDEPEPPCIHGLGTSGRAKRLARSRHSGPVSRRTAVTPMSWRDRLWQILTTLLSGAAGNVLTNIWSNDYRYRSLFLFLILGLVTATTKWMRQLPPRAPIVRYFRIGSLSCALGCAVVAATSPAVWVGPAAIAAACLVGVAVVILTDLREFTRTLFGAALTGLVITMLQEGFHSLQEERRIAGIQALVLAAVGSISCLAIMRDSRTLRRSALGLMRACFAIMGFVLLFAREPIGSFGFAVGAAIAHSFHGRAPKDEGTSWDVVPGVLTAAPSMRKSHRFRQFVDRRVATSIGLGLFSILMSVFAFVAEKALIGFIFAVGGLACLVRSAQMAPHGNWWPAVQRRLLALTRDSHSAPPAPAKEEPTTRRLVPVASNSGGKTNRARNNTRSSTRRRRSPRR